MVIGRCHLLPGGEVVRLQEVQRRLCLALFPQAGIMVPGVLVHSLCISVILPSCDDRYIFYKRHSYLYVSYREHADPHVLLCEHP